MKSHPRGAGWEALAQRHLQRHGLRLVQRNFHCRQGEIDLVMRDGPTLVFTEVRYRASDRHGSPLETVGHWKQARIIRCAQYFLALNPRWFDRPCRFDVVGITGPSSRPRIDWIRGAFDTG